MLTTTYPSDVSDAEWFILAPRLTPQSRRGRPRVHQRRARVNASLDGLRPDSKSDDPDAL